MCRGFFAIWKPIPGFGRMRSSAHPLAPQHVSGPLDVQVRVHPEFGSSRATRPDSFSSRFVMATRGSQPLSGAEVLMLSPVAICTPAGALASAVLNLISLRRTWYMSNPVLTIGPLSRLLLSYGSCLLVRDTTSFSL